MNNKLHELPLWLHGLKVIAEIIALALIPVLIFYVTDKHSQEQKDRESKDRRAAISIQYIEISIGILREDPSKQKVELREWAIDILKKYSPIPLSQVAIEELKKKPLHVEYVMDAGAVIGGAADVKFHHAAPKQ